jgi:multiple antibiotic resistance protein
VKATAEEELEGTSKEDVGIVPLGLPTLAGPGAITTIVALLGQAGTLPEKTMVYLALVLVLLASWGILAAAPAILRRVSQTGLNVMTRIMGLLVTVIGVQFVLDGLRDAWSALF